MIFEQTATHTPEHALRVRRLADMGNVVEFTGFRSTGWQKRLPGVVTQAKTATAALLRALASVGSPAFFELERRGPTQQRLGPGLIRESDSFWPLSQW
jgi:hypothetical protein